MAHPVALGAEVALVVRVKWDLDVEPARHLETELAEPAQLPRVVREKSHARYAEVVEDGLYRPISSEIVGETELAIGVNCVAAKVLQPVRGNLVRDSDAAALLLEVDDHPAVLPNELQRRRQLFATVAAQRAEDFRGEALVVHADGDTGWVGRQRTKVAAVDGERFEGAEAPDLCTRGPVRAHAELALGATEQRLSHELGPRNWRVLERTVSSCRC